MNTKALITCAGLSGLLLLSGCSQKAMQLVPNVDKLLKENESLNKRVSTLESERKSLWAKDLEELKKSMSAINLEIRSIKADSSINIEKLRQDFAFLKGSVEEAQHSGEAIQASAKSLESSLVSVDERLSALEKASAEAEKKTEELKTSLEEAQGKWDAGAQARADEARPARSDPEALYLSGYQETMAKNYDKASEQFKKFLMDFPGHKLSDHAQYWLGEINYAKGDWEKAILEFNKVIEGYPAGEKVAAATLKQGFSFEKLGSMKEARVLLQRVVERFPKTAEANIAKKRLESFK